VTVEVTRARFGSLLEWAVAAACALAIATLGSLIFQGLRTPRGIVRVNVEAAEAAPMPDPPAAIPARAVSVPLILLNDGTELRVGERESTISAKVKRAWQTGVETLERTTAGTRITRAVRALKVSGSVAQLLEARRGRERCGGHDSLLS